MKRGLICSDLGYECTMENCLTCKQEPVYRWKKVPACGVDARPGDTRDVIDGNQPIGFERHYEAFRECTHCHRIEFIGSKRVPINVELTFEDFLNEKQEKEKFEKQLELFNREQEKAREQFILKNKPKTR